jgi:hypothetical protein
MPDPALSHAAGMPKRLLRLEGLVLGILGVWLFARTGFSWWLFAGLILAPDLGMIGYAANPKLGAIVYNASHTMLGPAFLVAVHLVSGPSVLLALGSIWAAHIGFDRAFGYGLKYASRFGDTHLGVVGQPPKAA